jgi:tripartite-type tricarboxylate transporter receptor subunit TctC
VFGFHAPHSGTRLQKMGDKPWPGIFEEALMTVFSGIFRAGVMATTAGLVLASSPLAAQSVEQFYKGKQMTITIGHPPGGSYDLYARLAADYMGKFLPGKPNIIVQHRPGGGGVKAVAWFYEQAPRDGSNMGLFPETIGHTQLLQPEIGKWKLEEMHYVGSFAPSNAAFMARKGAPATTVDGLRKTKITVGCTGRNSQSYQYPASLKALGDFKFNLVCGYPGSAEVILALTRGEVDMFSASWHAWAASHRQEIADGKLIPVIQGGLVRVKDLPNVPLMQEVVDDPKAKKVLEFISAGAAIGRALIAPPKVPADRLAALRAAFDKMVEDPAFQKDAAKRKADLEPTPGVEVQKYAHSIATAPKDVIAAAKKAIEE